jgi:inosine-uridine nucleoside N-ribohydrolase
MKMQNCKNLIKYFNLVIIICFFSRLSAQQKSLIIDADTGNEMDDLYAIVRALADEELEVIGITSAHFNNPQLLTDSLWHIYPTEDINTVRISQKLNEQILQSMNMDTVPHPLGCDRMVGYAWGYYEGAPIPESPATEFIIEQARKHSPANKLNIMCLGAVTNVASAILQDSSIAKSIRLYCLTMKYDVAEGVWNKNSFNARNDINGLDIILNERNLECWIIPGNVSATLRFNHKNTVRRLQKIESPTARILEKRWEEVDAGKEWIMWDLALVEAFINPELAEVEARSKPPENRGGNVKVYIDIKKDKMIDNFWQNYLRFERNR